MHQVHNDISLPKTFWLSLWGKRKKSNVNFLSITLGYFVKNVQMKSYDFIINMCLFHPTHSMALQYEHIDIYMYVKKWTETILLKTCEI